jgi:hypothetical protein
MNQDQKAQMAELEKLHSLPFSGHNFLDLKAIPLAEGKIKFKSEGKVGEAIFFISEDLSLHLFGSDSEKVKTLLGSSAFNESFSVAPRIFTTEKIAPVLQGIHKNLKLCFDYEYHQKPIPKTQEETDPAMSFRYLDLNSKLDKEILAKWYQEYNHEMSTSWNIPLEDPKQKHIIMYDSSTKKDLGFVSLSLPSAKRLWFGRFYIPKDQRGMSYAKKLLTFLDNLSINENKALSLLVHTDNEKALKLYKASGYHKIDKIEVLEKI